MPEMPRICIVGAGAVGCLLGAKLCVGGYDVTLVGRGAHLAAVAAEGMSINDHTNKWGNVGAVTFDRVFEEATLPADLEHDIVLVTTRAADTADAARTAAALLRPAGLAVSIQNGIGNVEKLAAAVGWDRVAAGTITTGIRIDRPGHLEVTVHGSPLYVGGVAHPEAPQSEPIYALRDLLRLARIPAEHVPDIRAIQWRKLIYNCCLNPTASVLEAPYVEVYRNEETRSDSLAIIDECYAVAAAHRVLVDPPGRVGFYHWLFGGPEPAEGGVLGLTANHFPSMLAHLRAGKRTEIEALNGAVVRLGRDAGIPVPVNERYTKRIHDLEDQVLRSAPPGGA